MASFTAEAAATSKEPALQGNEGAGNPEGESKTAALPSRLRASLQCSGLTGVTGSGNGWWGRKQRRDPSTSVGRPSTWYALLRKYYFKIRSASGLMPAGLVGIIKHDKSHTFVE